MKRGEKTLKIEEVQKALEEAKLEPYGLSTLMQHVNGMAAITKKGNLKLTIELPKEVLKRPSIPFKLEDYAIVPLLLFCTHKEQKEEIHEEG